MSLSARIVPIAKKRRIDVGVGRFYPDIRVMDRPNGAVTRAVRRYFNATFRTTKLLPRS
jgi:hypothetical protein